MTWIGCLRKPAVRQFSLAGSAVRPFARSRRYRAQTKRPHSRTCAFLMQWSFEGASGLCRAFRRGGQRDAERVTTMLALDLLAAAAFRDAENLAALEMWAQHHDSRSNSRSVRACHLHIRLRPEFYSVPALPSARAVGFSPRGSNAARLAPPPSDAPRRIYSAYRRKSATGMSLRPFRIRPIPCGARSPARFPLRHVPWRR